MVSGRKRPVAGSVLRSGWCILVWSDLEQTNSRFASLLSWRTLVLVMHIFGLVGDTVRVASPSPAGARVRIRSSDANGWSGERCRRTHWIAACTRSLAFGRRFRRRASTVARIVCAGRLLALLRFGDRPHPDASESDPLPRCRVLDAEDLRNGAHAVALCDVEIDHHIIARVLQTMFVAVDALHHGQHDSALDQKPATTGAGLRVGHTTAHCYRRTSHTRFPFQTHPGTPQSLRHGLTISRPFRPRRMHQHCFPASDSGTSVFPFAFGNSARLRDGELPSASPPAGIARGVDGDPVVEPLPRFLVAVLRSTARSDLESSCAASAMPSFAVMLNAHAVLPLPRR